MDAISFFHGVDREASGNSPPVLMGFIDMPSSTGWSKFLKHQFFVCWSLKLKMDIVRPWSIFRKRHSVSNSSFFDIHLGHRSPYQGTGLEINKQKRSEWVSYKPLMAIPPTQTDGYIVGPLQKIWGTTRGIRTPFSRGCLGVLVMLEKYVQKKTSWWFQLIWKIWSSNCIIPPKFGVKIKNIWVATTQKTPNPCCFPPFFSATPTCENPIPKTQKFSS